MAAGWIEALTGSFEQKKQYKAALARIDALAEPYRATGRAVHRYTMYYGAIAEGDILVTMLTDLVDLWERAAIDGTPLTEIVGDDPVEFAETFIASYRRKEWIDKERGRLRAVFEKSTGEGS